MPVHARLLPALSLVLLALVAALPWGLDSTARKVMPMLPVAAILVWGARRPESLPAWLVLVVGVAFDAVTSGPLGLWALLWLAALAIVRVIDGPGRGLSGLILAALGALAGVGFLRWAAVSLYDIRLNPWRTDLEAAVWSALTCLLLAALLHDIDPGRTERAVPRLRRGG